MVIKMAVGSKIRVSLNSDLRKKYGIRAFPIAKGDIVNIMAGGRKGEGGKVIDINHRTNRVSVEGITIAKADGKAEEYFIAANLLQITKLELSRPERLQKLRDLASRKNIVVEEEPEPVKEEVEEAESSEEAQEEEAEEEQEEEPEKEEEGTEEDLEEPGEEESEEELEESDDEEEEEPKEVNSDDQ